MKINKFIKPWFILMMIVFVISIVSFAAAQEDMKESGAIKEKRRTSDADYHLEAQLMGGQMINYATYMINSPFLEGNADFDIHYRFTKNLKADAGIALKATKFFQSVEQSNHTLNSVFQKYNAGLGLKMRKMWIKPAFYYYWMLRPDWPDLYQPDPAVYNPVFNPDDIRYRATDRYSYRKANPELTVAIYPVRDVSAYVKAEYERKMGYIDPNFNGASPNHLTPDRHHTWRGELGAKYDPEKMFFLVRVKSGYYKLSHEYELSRDRVTGLTHYLTNPNPLYKETNYFGYISPGFKVAVINLVLAPYYRLEYNMDEFQGYYTYTAHEFGLEVEETLFQEKLRLKADIFWKLIDYTSDGYGTSAGHIPLTDGSVLYKRYTVFTAEASYLIADNLRLIAEYYMKIKKTNYPKYEPGYNPTSDTKNYEIDFSFDNYRVNAGIEYFI